MNNKLDKLITLLEKVSNKKVKLVNIKESEIFKPLRINERLKDLKEKFDSKCTFDHSSKTLTYNGDIEEVQYSILLKNYKGYKVNINGSVWLDSCNLNSIDIKFGKITGSFECSNNNLTSFKNCPEEIEQNLYCDNNKLISLEYFPKIVDRSIYFQNNSKQFTKQEVLKYCNVGDEIII